MSYFTNRWWYEEPLFWIIFLADRLSKMFVQDCLSHGRAYKIMPFLSFDYSINRGMAFGMLHDYGRIVFGAITLFVFLALCFLVKYTFDRQKAGHAVVGETLILAGGYANLVDRLLHTGVIDFIRISYGPWVFPIFNIADVAISVGALLVLLHCFITNDSE